MHSGDFNSLILSSDALCRCESHRESAPKSSTEDVYCFLGGLRTTRNTQCPVNDIGYAEKLERAIESNAMDF